MPEAEDRFRSILRGLAEPSLALIGAFALTGLLTLPFLPLRLQLEVVLRPEVGREVVSHARLQREVEALGVADEVQVLLVSGKSRLVLAGVEDADRVEAAVADLLTQSGYQRDDWIRQEVFHLEGLLRAEPRTLPIMMSIQALVFSLAGILLVRGRLVDGMAPAVTSWQRAALWGVGAGVAALLLNAAGSMLLKLTGFPVEEQAWLMEAYSDPATLVRISPWVMLIGPVAEELFFRFYAFRFITKHAGFPIGLVMSSLMFAIPHFNPSGLLIYLGIGCVLGWVYQRTGRLVAPIVGHVVLNSIVLISVGAATSAGL